MVAAGRSAGQYGSLAVSRLATLDGPLALDLTGRFAPAAGDVFNLMTFAGVGDDFKSFWLDGAPCSKRAGDAWSCSGLGGPVFEETFGSGFLNLDVVSAPFFRAAGDAVPEPSSRAMLRRLPRPRRPQPAPTPGRRLIAPGANNPGGGRDGLA